MDRPTFSWRENTPDSGADNCSILCEALYNKHIIIIAGSSYKVNDSIIMVLEIMVLDYTKFLPHILTLV